MPARKCWAAVIVAALVRGVTTSTAWTSSGGARRRSRRSRTSRCSVTVPLGTIVGLGMTVPLGMSIGLGMTVPLATIVGLDATLALGGGLGGALRQLARRGGCQAVLGGAGLDRQPHARAASEQQAFALVGSQQVLALVL